MSVIKMPQPEKKMRTRISLLIFPHFQLALIGANAAIMVVVAAMTWIQMRHSLSDLSLLASMSGPERYQYQRYLDFQTSQLNFSFMIAVLTGLAFSTALTLVISHRFSGPLVRLRNYFKSISEGTHPVPKLTFRKGDFLGDLPPLVNSAVQKIEERTETGEKGAAVTPIGSGRKAN